MKAICRAIVSVLLTCWLLTSHAALDLILTKGMRHAMPIAIVPLANEQNNLAAGQQSLSAIINNDLQNSGQFIARTIPALSSIPSNISQVNIAYWRRLRANNIVVGRIDHINNHRYQVRFQLINLYDHKNPVVLSQSLMTSKAGLRRVAHHISNQIFEKLTNIRGVFNTKISYVLVQHHSNSPTMYRLQLADADGFNPQTLLQSQQPIMSPTWAPNGKQLAYVSFEQHRARIFLQNVQTGKRQVISDYAGINGAPAFSPDGKKLALVLTRTGNPKLYLLDLASRHLEQLTHGYAIDTEPSWSPDGQSLLFTSNRGGTPQIYRIGLKDRHITRITYHGNYNARASFSPDKHSIVMMHRDTGLFGIARQNLMTSRVHILSQSGYDESPSVAPNGKMIVYATQYGGRHVLAITSSDGQVKLRLPSGDGDVQEPTWGGFSTG